MAADPFANPSDDLDRWYGPPGHDLGDPWHAPADQRATERRQLRRYQAGFAVLGFALVIASLFGVGALLGIFLLIFFRTNQLLQALRPWDFAVESSVVFTSFLGACLLWGRWPDGRWGRRSGLLLMMCLTDVLMWSLDHAVWLGLASTPFGHDHFREALGRTLGWCQYALILSLAVEMATRFGEERAADFGRAVGSLITVGAVSWLFYFYNSTDWRPPVWPLRPVPLRQGPFLMRLGNDVLSTVVLVQVTMACLYAGRTCGAAVRALEAEDRADEPFLSRSEAGWDELHRGDPDRHR